MNIRYIVCTCLACLFLVACADDEARVYTDLPPAGVTFADFETFDTTPYYFRYGNQKKSDVLDGVKVFDFYPRWAYAYSIADNPLRNADNTSEKVLEYVSLEARDFGIKFRFPKALKLERVKSVSFQIYQPANVLNKDTWENEPQATNQQVAVKLLGGFNGVNDCVQEDGVLLANSTALFTEEGNWVTYTFTFSEEEYPSAKGLLPEGIVGLAVMPTYGSATTLAEKDIYKCYIDNIRIL